MKIKTLGLMIVLLGLLISPYLLAQSKQTGSIDGTIFDEQKTPLPGVTVTLSGPNLMGARTFITGADGGYRFPAIPPGTYAVKAELQGFKTVIREEIRLTTTVRLTADITLTASAIAEQVTVIAKSPTVDVKTSETASVTVTDEMLRNVPTMLNTYELLNMAPGVSEDVAYGASTGTGISYQVDGVGVGDTEAGTAWVFLDYNVVQEFKVMGVGLNAEYGAFTGVIFNTITKSGGNQFSGHGEFIFQDTKKGFWTAENNGAYIHDFPDLVSPVAGHLDTSLHLGGPILKDKLWFFAGGQYARAKYRPAGFEGMDTTTQPRAFLKISAQPSSKFNLTLYGEFDRWDRTNRGASARHFTTDTTVTEKAPEIVLDFTLTYILSPRTFVDFKVAGYAGYYYLSPNGTGTALQVAADNDKWYNNSYYFYKADRKRFQSNASLSHYAEDFIKGNHDFKFGAEFEYGWARSRYGYTGTGNYYIYDYYGYQYAYQYAGYDINNHYTRTEFFAQDSWAITKTITLNFGGRYSLLSGYAKGIPGAVYTANRIAPRVGFAWDILGNHSTVLKAHYGQYTDSMYTAVFDRLDPLSAYSDKHAYYYDSGVLTPWYTTTHEAFTRDPKIKHPYLEQFTVGVERELFRDASLGVTFIGRKWKNMIGLYDTAAQYETQTVDDPYTTTTYTVYNQLNPGTYHRILGNIAAGYQMGLDAAGNPLTMPENAFRKYQGLEFSFNKRMSNRWQLLLSYVYSKCTGTIDNDQAADVGWTSNRGLATNDPNYWINILGHAYYDPKHMLKAQGTYMLPFGINFSAYFHLISGDTYTRQYRYKLDQGRITFLTETRGDRRYPTIKRLDLRLEKTFTFSRNYRIGFLIDVFNVFNANTITDWGTRIDYDWYPTDPAAPGPNGHEVLSLVDPRAIRVGLRFFF
jgi:hypothetical protein